MSNSSFRKGRYQALKELYETNITVDSIAENMVVRDLNDDAMQIREEMDKLNYDVVGVKENGIIIGFVEREELESGAILKYCKGFLMSEIITNTTPLIQFLHIFKNRSRIFVLEKNEVTKLITSADLQKPPIRILIFGYITLLEMNLGELIKIRFRNQEWKPLISEKRLKKANALFQERQTKNEDIHLIDCLQISDKLQIIKNDEYLINRFKITSKSQWRKIQNNIRDLRDRIAHSNELGINQTWEEIIDILAKCEFLLEKCDELIKEDA